MRQEKDAERVVEKKALEYMSMFLILWRFFPKAGEPQRAKQSEPLISTTVFGHFVNTFPNPQAGK